MNEQAAPATGPDRYSWPKRVLLLVLGGAAAVVGASVPILLLGLFVHAVRDDRLTGHRLIQAGVAVLAVALIFGGFGAMGVRRAMSGVRGRPGPRRAEASRADLWLWRNWYLIGFVGTAAWTALFMSASDGLHEFLLGRNAERLPWYALLALLVIPVHVAVHELGHAAAGALMGFRFGTLQVGWVAVTREGGRYRLAWKRPALVGALGFHAGAPVGPGSLGARMAVHAAAGPAVTFLATLICGAAAKALGHPSGDSQTVAVQLLNAAMWSGVWLTVSSVAPFRTRWGITSDGALVLRALRAASSPAAAAALRFHALSAEGRRPREWGIAAQEFLEAAGGAKGERDALHLAAVAVALDVGDEALAADILARALALPSRHAEPSMRYEIELQAAMVDAFDGRAAAARERLVRAGRSVYPGYDRLAAAVVDAAEGRLAEARAGLEAWERAVAASGRADSVLVGNRWAVEKLRTRLEAGRA